RFWYGRRAALRELFAEGQRIGEFRRGVDPEFLMDVLYAPIYFRLLWGHMPLDDQFVEELVKNVMPLLEVA
ncbi:TetR family transcriptional regulator, partial [Pseudomaricurvus alcaniphilus]|uniref:TetR-like C-terminal domain-containing protein n=1 Tax=Pseudomaricurvus alcaniphilus TaxID=1166482 RepID=UPI001A9F4CFE